jgi:hypothetical protein
MHDHYTQNALLSYGRGAMNGAKLLPLPNYEFLIYRIFPSYASKDVLSYPDSCVTSGFPNKCKTYTSKTQKSPLSGGHKVINDVGQHQK